MLHLKIQKFNWIQIQLKNNGMQIGAKDIENMLLTMKLKQYM